MQESFSTTRGRRAGRFSVLAVAAVVLAACGGTVVEGRGSASSLTTRAVDSTGTSSASASSTPRTTTRATESTRRTTTQRPTRTATRTTPPPQPTRQNAPGVETFLGASIEDAAFADYLFRYGCTPGGGNWNCRATATEFALSTGSTVTAVMMKAPGVANPEGYRGALPVGIAFDDSPEELVARLGQPVAGSVAPNSFLKWEGDGIVLFVDFWPQAPVRIHTVQLQLS